MDSNKAYYIDSRDASIQRNLQLWAHSGLSILPREFGKTNKTQQLMMMIWQSTKEN